MEPGSSVKCIREFPSSLGVTRNGASGQVEARSSSWEVSHDDDSKKTYNVTVIRAGATGAIGYYNITPSDYYQDGALPIYANKAHAYFVNQLDGRGCLPFIWFTNNVQFTENGIQGDDLNTQIQQVILAQVNTELAQVAASSVEEEDSADSNPIESKEAAIARHSNLHFSSSYRGFRSSSSPPIDLVSLDPNRVPRSPLPASPTSSSSSSSAAAAAATPVAAAAAAAAEPLAAAEIPAAAVDPADSAAIAATLHAAQGAGSRSPRRPLAPGELTRWQRVRAKALSPTAKFAYGAATAAALGVFAAYSQQEK